MQNATAAELSAPATQFIVDRESYLGQGRRDIGRRVSATQIELFVSGEATAALEQQLMEFAPDFIALNDVAGHAAQGLLAALASGCNVEMQTLAIRRQGQGVALAELPFIELPAADMSPVRIFGADINSDTRTRQHVAQVLMAHSRLGVLLVADLPRHSIPPALAPWREAIARGPWSNGDLLVVPLAAMPTLGVEAAHLAGRSGVNVELVAVATRAADALMAIVEAWNRQQLRHQGSARLSLPGAASKSAAAEQEASASWAASTVPMELEPETPPAIKTRDTALAPMPVPGCTRWDDYAHRIAALRGAVACCIFDHHSEHALAAAGGRPSGERLAAQGATLVKTMIDAGRAIGVGPVLRDATLTLGRYQLLLLAISGHPGLWLHLVIDNQTVSAAVAHAMLEKLTP